MPRKMLQQEREELKEKLALLQTVAYLAHFRPLRLLSWLREEQVKLRRALGQHYK